MAISMGKPSKLAYTQESQWCEHFDSQVLMLDDASRIPAVQLLDLTLEPTLRLCDARAHR